MKPNRWLISVALLVVATGTQAQVKGNISLPAARQTSITTMEALLAVRPPQPPGGIPGLKDPFNPSENDLREDYDPNAVRIAKPVDTISGPELLRVLAGKLRPTGVLTRGGEPYLQFGEKRQKKGDKLIIAHDGVDYLVEITNIETNRFSLRYNDQELTRSVK